MLPYRRCDCSLRIFCAAFIMVVTATFEERQPVGLEMCKDHCGHCDDCTFCVFLIKRLACIATWSKYPLQTHGEEAVYLKISKKTLGSYSQRKELCTERHSRIVLSRSKGFRCIKRRTEEKTRLLVAPYMKGSKTPLRALQLPNGSITTYYNINQQYVLALAYVPTLQKLLMATSSPMKIRSFSLHSKDSLTVRSNIRALSMAVDDAQQLVFLSSRSPHSCLYRMTPDGTYFKKITCRPKLWTVCLDTRRELVYVATSSQIYSSEYNGQGLRKIPASNEVHGLTLSDNGEAIYYKDKTNLMELWLFKNGKRRKLTRLQFRVKNIVRNKGDLFISSMENKFIHLWHESKLSRLGEANPDGRTKQVIALVP